MPFPGTTAGKLRVRGWRAGTNWAYAKSDGDEEGNDIDDKIDEAKGRIKEAAGDLTDNDELKAEGKIDQGKGKVKGFIDDIADKLKG